MFDDHYFDGPIKSVGSYRDCSQKEKELNTIDNM